jgi:nitrous oxidase accessory protein NosD
VARGVSEAQAGDIVLIRPGHYNEPMTISKAVALRATRGDALIGKP